MFVFDDDRERRRYLSTVLVAALALLAVFLLLRAAQEESVQVIATSDLEKLFAGTEVTDLRTAEGATLSVTAVIRTTEDISIEQVTRAERLLSLAVDQPVALEVVVERVIRQSLWTEAD